MSKHPPEDPEQTVPAGGAVGPPTPASARSAAELTVTSAGHPSNTPVSDYLPRLEGYEVLGRLGEGGMGVVWKAIQLSTKRQVALKLMSAASFGSERSRLRFEREVELTAKLDHPHIARVYDSGIRQGVFFYAMELIDGVRLDQYVTQSQLSRRQIVELMAVVCEAVQYAHQKGIIHRDLKPSNIIVDAQGQPHVLDFGLAKALEADQQLSLDGEVAGTPAYMSPEQASGKLDKLDTRSDVYTLGVILFHLLTGQFPHDNTGSALELMKRISETEPRRLKDIEPKPDADLGALLSKALDREPQRRYLSAGGMAEDLHRYLKHEPLIAQPPTFSYILRKNVRRHRLPLGITAGVLAILLGMAVYAYMRITKERDTAVSANVEKEKQRQEAAAQKQAAVRETSRAAEQAALASRATTRAITGEESAELRLAESMLRDADALSREGNWQKARETAEEVLAIYNRLNRPTLPADIALSDIYRFAPPALNVTRSKDSFNGAALSPDGRTLLSAGGELKLLDARTGSVLTTLKGHFGPVRCVAFLPDGRAVSAGDDATPRLWDVAARKELRTLRGHQKPVYGISVSRNGRFLASCGDDEVRLWDVESGATVQTFQSGAGIRSMSLSPDANRLLVSTSSRALLWSASTGETIRSFSGGGRDIILDPEGKTFLNGGSDGWVDLLDAETGKSIWRIQAHTDRTHNVRFTPDGRMAVTAGDNTIKVWAIETRRLLRSFAEKSVSPNLMQVSLDGRLVVAASGKDLLLWELPPGSDEQVFEGSGVPIESVALSPDGLIAASVSSDNQLQLWDVASGRRVAQWTKGPFRGQVKFTQDGRSLLAGGVLCDVLSGRKIGSYGAIGEYLAAMAPDGTSVVTGGPQSLHLWNAEAGAAGHDFQYKGLHVNSIAFAPDGQHFVTGNNAGQIEFWDPVARKRIASIGVGGKGVSSLTYSPDGRYVLAGGDDWVVKLLDVAAGKVAARFVGHTGVIARVAFSPDGRMAASSSDDGTMRLWDTASGRPIHTFAAHEGGAFGLAFAPDGASVLTGGKDGVLRRWDFTRAATYRQFAPRLEAARLSIEAANTSGSAVDPKVLKTFGEWYAFRHQWDWAASLLEEARAGGATVSSLELARCYAQLNNFPAAQREFRKAIAGQEAPKPYLDLCLRGIDRELLKPRKKAADQLVKSNRIDEAIVEYTGLLRDTPSDEDLLATRADLYAHVGRFKESLADFIKLEELDPGNHLNWYSVACLRLYLGDVDGYRRDCLEMLNRFAQSPDLDIAAHVAKACLLSPEPVADPKFLSELVDVATESTDKSTVQFGEIRKGMAEYRAGRFASAIEWLGKEHDLLPSSAEVLADLFQAMAQHRLGQTREAITKRAEAIQLLTTRVPKTPDLGTGRNTIANWLICQITRREAEDLMGGKPIGVRATQPATSQPAIWLWSRDAQPRPMPKPLRSATQPFRENPSDRIVCVAISTDGSKALSGSFNTRVKLWDVRRGAELLKNLAGHTDGVHSVAFSADGKTALSAGHDGVLKLWDLSTGREIRTFSGHTGPVRCGIFSPDGTAILSASDDKTLKLWDIATGHELRTFRGHTDFVYWIAFSPDGRLAVSAGRDKTPILWDVATGHLLARCKGHSDITDGIAFSPDGRTVLSASRDKSVRLWDADTGKEIRAFVHQVAIHSIAFTPDGRCFVSGGADGVLHLWDIASGKKLRSSARLGGEIHGIAITPDGLRAFAACENAINFWSLANGPTSTPAAN